MKLSEKYTNFYPIYVEDVLALAADYRNIPLMLINYTVIEHILLC
ncbi:MAG: hypothetical protein R2728_07495 [Chitinophagales bacterium]